MSQEQPGPSPEGPRRHLQPGQTLIFLGDHTSPDDQGYVAIVREVIARFHPELRPNFISAGSRGQKAAALRSPELLALLASSRPDWLVIGIGLADALSEPEAAEFLAKDSERASPDNASLDATFGPVHVARAELEQPPADSGPRVEPKLERIGAFERDIDAALANLGAAGMRLALLTLTTPGPDRFYSINAVLHAYSRAIRRAAEAHDALLIDIDLAFRNLFDRAADYKQSVSLTGQQGGLNAQGQTLIARTFLDAFGVLPYPGFRGQH